MNSESISVPETAPPPLPELHQGVLSEAQVWQLFADIEQCTRVLEILPKHAAAGRVADAAGVTLAQARELVAARAVRALQLRYEYDGAEWWDTLMLNGGQFRVVRIRHDFGREAGA